MSLIILPFMVQRDAPGQQLSQRDTHRTAICLGCRAWCRGTRPRVTVFSQRHRASCKCGMVLCAGRPTA